MTAAVDTSRSGYRTGDPGAALAAPPAKQEPAEHGDVVPVPDLSAAARTLRPGRDDRLPRRHAGGDHRHEAADGEAEHRQQDEEYRGEHGRTLDVDLLPEHLFERRPKPSTRSTREL